MTKLAKTSLVGKFKNVIFLTKPHEIDFQNLLEKEFNKSTCQHKAFEIVQIAKQRNFSIAQQLEQSFNLKYHPNTI